MAEDWIKMRTDLFRHPKVCLMADRLMTETVTRDAQRDAQRNVTRNAVVGALVTVWGVMRHRGERIGDDMRYPKASRQLVDDLTCWPGFGAAMVDVQWLLEVDGDLVFPEFFAQHNVEIAGKKKGTAAERQARYRERLKARNVTGDVAQRDAQRVAQQVAQRDDRDRGRDRVNEEATASSCPQASQPAGRTDEPKRRKTARIQQPCTIEEAFCTVPVIGHEEQWRLPRAKLQEWQATFPGVNVEQATCEAVQWLLDNPSKRKTPKGILRFFNFWLSKEQDRGPRQLFRTNHTTTQDRAITREQQQHAVFAHLNAIASQQQARLTHDASGGG